MRYEIGLMTDGNDDNHGADDDDDDDDGPTGLHGRGGAWARLGWAVKRGRKLVKPSQTGEREKAS